MSEDVEVSAVMKDYKRLPLTLGGIVLGVAGVVWMRWDRAGTITWPGIIVALIGLALFFLSCWLHDRAHRQRGEQPHALGRRQ